jgi:endonuclease YncB( thermonuclease family)
MLAAGTAWAKGDVIAGPVEAELLKVVDGDTIVVRAKLWPTLVTETHVRLKGIDAPELRGHCPAERQLAEKARRFVAKQTAGRPLRLLDVQQDKYGGRVVARVEAAGHDLGRQLLKAGLARKYDGGKRQGWC